MTLIFLLNFIWRMSLLIKCCCWFYIKSEYMTISKYLEKLLFKSVSIVYVCACVRAWIFRPCQRYLYWYISPLSNNIDNVTNTHFLDLQYRFQRYISINAQMKVAYDTVMDLEERLNNKGIESPCTDQTLDLWIRRRDFYRLS